MVSALSAGDRSVELRDLRFQLIPGPPHRSVYALAQDHEGFVWIGTADGLARFDGYEMNTLRHNPNDRR